MDLPKIWPGHKLPDAVLGGSIDELKDLLYQAPDAIDLIGPGGYTALHVAVFKEDRNMIDLLFKNNANPRQLASNGDHCGHIACRIGSMKMLEEFVNYMDDIYMINNNNETMQMICERIPTEEEAFKEMYTYQEWNDSSDDAHLILKDELTQRRIKCCNMIKNYRETWHMNRRKSLVKSFIKNGQDRQLSARVFRAAGGAMERRFYMTQQAPETWNNDDLIFFEKHREDVLKSTSATLAGDFISRSTETAIKTLAPNQY